MYIESIALADVSKPERLGGREQVYDGVGGFTAALAFKRFFGLNSMYQYFICV